MCVWRVELGVGGGVCVCVCVCVCVSVCVCVCVCVIFAFAFSIADRKREPIPDDRTVSEKARYPYMNQQMIGETGRECTTEEDQQNTEVQNILPSFRCCLMSSDVG